MCRETKILAEFHISKTKTAGRTSRCAFCINRYGSRYYASLSQEKKLEMRKRARARSIASPRHTLNINLLTAIKYRPCDNPISLDELEGLFIAQGGRCALSGVEMTWARGQVLATSISLDRIDTDGGYTSGNVRLLCHSVNAFRARMSDAEMIELARAIVAKADCCSPV